MFDDITPEEMEQASKNLEHKYNLDFQWKLGDSIVNSGGMLGVPPPHYRVKNIEKQLADAVANMRDWNKGGDEAFLQLGHMLLRQGVSIRLVIELLQQMFSAVASEYEYGD